METNEWIIVTGANGGIGKATTEKLAAAGYPVIMACRNLEKAAPICDRLNRTAGHAPVRLLFLDLESLRSITGFCRILQDKHIIVKALINNAGILSPRFRLSATGFESDIAVNYIGTALLTLSLLPLIKKGGKIINIGSCTWRLGKIDDTFFNGSQTRYNRFRVYGTSKLALLLFTSELALHAPQVSVTAIDPGIVDTGMIRMHSWVDPLADFLFRPFILKPDYPAAGICRMIETDAPPNHYWNGDKFRPLPARILNHSCRQWLWQETLKLKTALTGGTICNDFLL